MFESGICKFWTNPPLLIGPRRFEPERCTLQELTPELAELRADAATLRTPSAEARQAERREAAAKQVRRISASAAHCAACVWRCGSAGRQRGHSEWWMHGDARAGE
jgi:hypothetical protein